MGDFRARARGRHECDLPEGKGVVKLDAKQALLSRVLDGLEEPITPAEARAVKDAVAALPADGLLSVTDASLDALDLRPAVEAAFVFQLLARLHPKEVRAQAYAADTLAGVMRAILTGDASSSRAEALARAPAFVDAFFARLSGAGVERSPLSRLA